MRKWSVDSLTIAGLPLLVMTASSTCSPTPSCVRVEPQASVESSHVVVAVFDSGQMAVTRARATTEKELDDGIPLVLLKKAGEHGRTFGRG